MFTINNQHIQYFSSCLSLLIYKLIEESFFSVWPVAISLYIFDMFSASICLCCSRKISKVSKYGQKIPQAHNNPTASQG